MYKIEEEKKFPISLLWLNRLDSKYTSTLKHGVRNSYSYVNKVKGNYEKLCFCVWEKCKEKSKFDGVFVWLQQIITNET